MLFSRLKVCFILPFAYRCDDTPFTHSCDGIILKGRKEKNIARGHIIKWQGDLQCHQSFIQQGSSYTASLLNRLPHSSETLTIAGTNVPTNAAFFIHNDHDISTWPVIYTAIANYSQLPPLPSMYLTIIRSEAKL